MDTRNPPYTPRTGPPPHCIPSRPSHLPTVDELLLSHRRMSQKRAEQRLQEERRLHQEALDALAKACEQRNQLLEHIKASRATTAQQQDTKNENTKVPPLLLPKLNAPSTPVASARREADEGTARSLKPQVQSGAREMLMSAQKQPVVVSARAPATARLRDMVLVLPAVAGCERGAAPRS